MKEILDIIGRGKELTPEEYKELWTKSGPVQIKVTEKAGACPFNIGDTFVYSTPHDKPQGVCSDLLHVLDLYIWRISLGFPSWESDNRLIYRIHCPSKKGTVWEMKKL